MNTATPILPPCRRRVNSLSTTISWGSFKRPDAQEPVGLVFGLPGDFYKTVLLLLVVRLFFGRARLKEIILWI